MTHAGDMSWREETGTSHLKSRDKIAQPDCLTLLAMSIENHGNGHTRQMLANLIANI